MTNDEFEELAALDELLRETAREAYNPPPPTPREAIWAGIEAARAARRTTPSSAATEVELAPTSAENTGERSVLPISRPRPTPQSRSLPRHLSWWGTGIAAALAIGIGLTRIVPNGGTPGETTSPPEPALAAETPSLVAEAPGPDEAVALAGSAGEDVATAGGERTGESIGERPANRAGEGRVPQGDRVPGERPAPGGVIVPVQATSPVRVAEAPATEREARTESVAAAQPFRVAALDHLGRAELLLTGFLVDARSGRIDPGLESEARELLSTTRLLLDSPAAAEPRLGGLLLDLELVLAQVARFPDNPTLSEFELIDQALNENDVVTRLRLAIPSGPLLARS